MAERVGSEFLAGGDISLAAEIARLGGSYRVDGQPCNAAEALRRRGCNLARLRLFTRDPAWDGVTDRYSHLNDLDYTVALAQQVKAAGLKLLLDFHYSDTWADPDKQGQPASWRHLKFGQLVEQVYGYTRDALTRLVTAGAAPDLVQAGNEVIAGLLWPAGRIDQRQGFAPAARLLRAGLDGVRAGAFDSQVETMIHIDRGGDRAGTQWFYDGLAAAGVEFDTIGLSYYPWWHGPLSALADNLRATAERYRQPVMVVETAYPWRDDWADQPNLRWPATPDGQRAYTNALLAEVSATPHGLGRGVCWWATEYLPVPGLPTHTWHDRALFGEGGEALPALAALGAAAGRLEGE